MKRTTKTLDLTERLREAVDEFKSNRSKLKSYMTENVTLGWRLMKLQEKVSKLQKKMTPHCPITSGSVYVAEHICETYEKIAILLEDITGLQWDIRSAERALAASFRNLTAAQACAASARRAGQVHGRHR